MNNATQTAMPANPLHVIVWRKIPSPTWLRGSIARGPPAISVIVWSRSTKVDVDLLMASVVIMCKLSTVLDGINSVVMQTLRLAFSWLSLKRERTQLCREIDQFCATLMSRTHKMIEPNERKERTADCSSRQMRCRHAWMEFQIEIA